jgi:hypothetical protein
MGKRTEKVTAGFGDQAKLFYYANLGVTAACLFDYFVLGHQWSLLTLAMSVLIINGFALWQRRHDLDDALRGDAEEEAAEAQSEASRDTRLRARGLR